MRVHRCTRGQSWSRDGAELATYAADLAVAIGTLRREKALLGGTHREQEPFFVALRGYVAAAAIEAARHAAEAFALPYHAAVR